MSQTPLKTLVITDRSDRKNGFLALDWSTNPPIAAYGEELNLQTGVQRALNVRTNTFCSSGAFMPDGAFWSIGGNQNNRPSEFDGFSIREFRPCLDGTCDFQLIGTACNTTKRSTALDCTAHHSSTQHSTAQHSVAHPSPAKHRAAQYCSAQLSTSQHVRHSAVQRSAARLLVFLSLSLPALPLLFSTAGNLTSSRWYPTAILIAEGRLLIFGGSFWGRFINGAGYNNPTFEYFPRRNANDTSRRFQFLERTMPYNLYPLVHLLPNGLVFVFAGVVSHRHTVLELHWYL